MPLKLNDVFARAGKETLCMVHDKEASIYYVVMNTPYNMIDNDFIKKYNDCLDYIEKSDGPGVMITIGTGPKVFCSGFNLRFWQAKKGNVESSISGLHKLLARILTVGMPSLCILNGKTVAGGVFIALAHD